MTKALVTLFIVIGFSISAQAETIDFGSLIEQGAAEKKELNQKVANLMEDAAYEQESKEVLEFVQEELDYLNKQQVVDNDKSEDQLIY